MTTGFLMTSVFVFVLFAGAAGAQSPATAKTKKQELTTKDARLPSSGKRRSGRRRTCQRWISAPSRWGPDRFN